MLLTLEGTIVVFCPLVLPGISNASDCSKIIPPKITEGSIINNVAAFELKCVAHWSPKWLPLPDPARLRRFVTANRQETLLLLAKEDIRRNRAHAQHVTTHRVIKHAEIDLHAVKRKHRWAQRRERLLDAKE